MNKEDREWYIETMNNLNNSIAKTEEIFEPLIIKLSSGAIAVSFSFITVALGISKNFSFQHTWALALGWLMLSLCLALNVLSHLEAKKIFKKHRNDINVKLAKNESDNENENITRTKNLIDRENDNLDKYYNKPTAWLLIVGIAFILLFTTLNLHQTQMHEQYENRKQSTGSQFK